MSEGQQFTRRGGKARGRARRRSQRRKRRGGGGPGPHHKVVKAVLEHAETQTGGIVAGIPWIVMSILTGLGTSVLKAVMNWIADKLGVKVGVVNPLSDRSQYSSTTSDFTRGISYQGAPPVRRTEGEITHIRGHCYYTSVYSRAIISPHIVPMHPMLWGSAALKDLCCSHRHVLVKSAVVKYVPRVASTNTQTTVMFMTHPWHQLPLETTWLAQKGPAIEAGGSAAAAWMTNQMEYKEGVHSVTDPGKPGKRWMPAIPTSDMNGFSCINVLVETVDVATNLLGDLMIEYDLSFEGPTYRRKAIDFIPACAIQLGAITDGAIAAAASVGSIYFPMMLTGGAALGIDTGDVTLGIGSAALMSVSTEAGPTSTLKIMGHRIENVEVDIAANAWYWGYNVVGDYQV